MITANEIYMSFQGIRVLHGVSLSVSDGEFVSIIGKSGSGKSTLLNILAGNLRPEGGRVLLDGTDLTAVKPAELAKLRRTKLGFVYQTLNLIPTLSAEDNMLLPLYLNKQSISEKKADADAITAMLGIDGLLHKFPRELSGGERQRVAIAKALLHDPSIIMLDEPTGSLDSKNAATVMELLLRINRELGVSIIQVTHNREAALLGHRIIELSDGRILSDGSVR